MGTQTPTISFINSANSFFAGVFKMEIKEPKSKFLKVRCPKCNNEQVIFGNASSVVGCLVCGKELAQPKGGKASVKARVLEVL
jgi:small subunit ribosomal protein S27e